MTLLHEHLDFIRSSNLEVYIAQARKSFYVCSAVCAMRVTSVR